VANTNSNPDSKDEKKDMATEKSPAPSENDSDSVIDDN